ncbi:hypothetical protein GGI03_008455, partial [Coemansia sp. RSA 2337]
PSSAAAAPGPLRVPTAESPTSLPAVTASALRAPAPDARLCAGHTGHFQLVGQRRCRCCCRRRWWSTGPGCQCVVHERRPLLVAHRRWHCLATPPPPASFVSTTANVAYDLASADGIREWQL